MEVQNELDYRAPGTGGDCRIAPVVADPCDKTRLIQNIARTLPKGMQGRSAPASEGIRMIRFYYHPTPNPAKIALFLEETGLPYEVVPVDTSKGEQHKPEFRAINPNGKVPAIVDTAGPGGAEVRVFDSSAILLYLAEKTGKLLGTPADRGELLSWLFYIGTGLGPFSGQAVHFQRAAPEKLPYAINRYRREAERHYAVLDKHLEGRSFIVDTGYTIADISAWGWIDRASAQIQSDDSADRSRAEAGCGVDQGSGKSSV